MLLDLATRQDILDVKALLEQVLASKAQPAAASADQLLTLQEVANHTKFDPRTVRQWVTKGRYNEAGKRVYLPALQYNDSLRFRLRDVEAFGLGTGVLVPSLLEAKPTAAKTPPAARKKRGAVSSAEALKVA